MATFLRKQIAWEVEQRCDEETNGTQTQRKVFDTKDLTDHGKQMAPDPEIIQKTFLLLAPSQ